MAEKKPILVDIIMCDDIREEINKKLSFIGVYTHKIGVPKLPFRLCKLCFSLKFKEGLGEFKIKIVLNAPSGVVASIDFPSKIKFNQGAVVGVISVFEGLEIKEEGAYQLKVYFNEDIDPSITFNFSITTPTNPSVIQHL